jgi:pathogenesis-related protein 1
MRRTNLPLLLAFGVLAACTAKNEGPGFDTEVPGSTEDAGGAAPPNGGTDDAAARPSDDAGDDATTQPTKPHSNPAPADASVADATVAQDAEADTSSASGGETGRLVGITAAHNAVRAMVSTQPALPPLTWSPTIAEYAQQWATQLASDPSTCAAPVHRSESVLKPLNYGENLAAFSGRGQVGNVSTAQQAVNGWASEVACWTYGTIMGSEKCDMTCTTNLFSDGCGHYTQIVWRKSLELGCGVATCQNGQDTEDIWICNYSPAGNIVGQAPY